MYYMHDIVKFAMGSQLLSLHKSLYAILGVPANRYFHCRFFFKKLFVFQGSIIFQKLRAPQVEEHVTKIREQYDFLEHFLTETKYIACDQVSEFD